MAIKIQIVEAEQLAGKQHRYVAEVNEYDKKGELVRQLSRSPFTFEGTVTEDEALAQIKDALKGYLPASAGPKKTKNLDHLLGKEL